LRSALISKRNLLDEEADHERDANKDRCQQKDIQRGVNKANPERQSESLISTNKEGAVHGYLGSTCGTILQQSNDLRVGWVAGYCSIRKASASPAVTSSLSKAPTIFEVTCENRIDMNTATPKVPPICLKKVMELVATPMSLPWTLFCEATVVVCNSCPSPRPIMTMPIETTQTGMLASSTSNRYR
jgi:hypothetical protein